MTPQTNNTEESVTEEIGREKDEKTIIRNVLAAFLSNVVCSSMTTAASPITIKSVPSTLVYASHYKITGNIGDTVDVNINISDVVGLCSYQVTITYNNTVVNCTQIIEDEF